MLLDRLWQARAMGVGGIPAGVGGGAPHVPRPRREEFLRVPRVQGVKPRPARRVRRAHRTSCAGWGLATSRVQKGHDLVTETGETVQVKYLANPEGHG